MSRAAVPLVLILALAVGCLAEFAYFYPQLPAVVASHFNAQGVPDAWMPKEKFARAMAVLFLILVACTIGMTATMRYAPAWMVNLPRKEYWLAPERAATTRRLLTQRSLWFWAAIWLYIAWLSHGTLQVNRGRAQAAPFIPALVFFLCFTAFWTGELLWRFGRIPKE